MISWRVGEWGARAVLPPAQFIAPARFGCPSIYHFSLPGGIPFYRFAISAGLPVQRFTIYHASVPIGRTSYFSVPARLPSYRFSVPSVSPIYNFTVLAQLPGFPAASF